MAGRAGADEGGEQRGDERQAAAHDDDDDCRRLHHTGKARRHASRALSLVAVPPAGRLVSRLLRSPTETSWHLSQASAASRQPASAARSLGGKSETRYLMPSGEGLRDCPIIPMFKARTGVRRDGRGEHQWRPYLPFPSEVPSSPVQSGRLQLALRRPPFERNRDSGMYNMSGDNVIRGNDPVLMRRKISAQRHATVWERGWEASVSPLGVGGSLLRTNKCYANLRCSG